ncbi:MAG: glycosyltransferase family 4 protein [Lentisphaeria bacterium]|nr:glycosyltransferase family 4 protein [Lentisphaeria bacterium]
MKICHVITRMIVGGAQENTLFTVMGHIEHDHETVLVTGPTDGPEGKLLQKTKVQNLKIEVIDSLIREINPLKDFQAYMSLKKFFKENRFDVVHTHSSKAGILARIAARQAGIPVVVHTVHGQSFHPYQSKLKNWVYIQAEKFAARYCDRIYAVADAMIQQCVDAGVSPRSKYQVVYSGMELEPYLNAKKDPELKASLCIPDDCFVVGKIARLFELKGHEYLIEAAKAIVIEIPNVRFLFVGDGSNRGNLEELILKNGLQEYFVFAGLVDPVEIPRYTGIMDILVHLSLREGLPRTVVQAFASGIPVVAYALDGTPEVVKPDENGFLCAAESEMAVATSVVRLLKDDEMRKNYGEAGREFVRQRWDWHTMVDQLEESYEKLLAEKKK